MFKASNQIKDITGLENLKSLQTLDLSSNQITGLEGLEGLEFLQTLSLQDNEVVGTSDLFHYLKKSQHLIYSTGLFRMKESTMQMLFTDIIH